MDTIFCILHDVRVDDSLKRFVFASEEDMDRFCEFISQYQRSGPGNGYGAYWIRMRDTQYLKAIPNGVERSLDPRRVESMAHSILKRRGVDITRDYTPPVAGRREGAITFDWALLDAGY